MIHERLHAVARSHGDRVAIVDEGATLTYAALLDRADALAATLASDAQVREADIILALLPNTAEFVCLFLAAARLGAVMMPLDPALRDHELRGYLDRIETRAAVTTAAFCDARPNALGGLPIQRRFTIETLVSAGRPTAPPLRTGPFEGVVAAFSTSGSTGTPKIVGRTQRGLLAGFAGLSGAIGVVPEDRVLGVTPFHHPHGLANAMIFSLMSGGTLVLMRRFVPRRLIEVVAGHRVSVVVGSPFIFGTVADCVTNRPAFASVRTAISSGAAVPVPIATAFLEKTGVRIRELYGSTETGIIALDGKPAEGVEIAILDDQGATVAQGATGEILVWSHGMAAGYLDSHGGWRFPLRNGFYPTGDLGHLDEEGRIVLEGRMSLRLNIAGVKVDPVEIERVIQSMPQVAQVAVSSVIGERGMALIKASVVVRQGEALQREAVVGRCRERLAEHKVPRIVEFVDALPENIMGKRVTGV